MFIIQFPNVSHRKHGTGLHQIAPKQMFHDPSTHGRRQYSYMFRRLVVLAEQSLTGSLPSSISQTNIYFPNMLHMVAVRTKSPHPSVS